MKSFRELMTILLILSLFILLLRQINRKEYLQNVKTYNTEIHFITFWNNDVNAKNRVINKINEYKQSFVRIIKKINIKKHDINRLFKKIQSGGKKYNKSDVTVFIIEVPSVYKIHRTFSNKSGENVNDYMYELKTAARGGYKNYKIAHGSFDVKEANDFFTEYFKYLGNFNNYKEILNELNSFNIFWIYDRVTVKEYGVEAGDTDLVVDSIPSACFILRTTKTSNKIYKKMYGKSKLFDLQDFDSNYYPKLWLLDIKKNNKIISANNIKIPTLLDHFMLGLYHMYMHKNGKQNNNRINILKDMSNKLGYNNVDIDILLNFLKTKSINISIPNDKKVGRYIKQSNINNKIIYFYNNKYY